MKITLFGAESLGVRGLSCLVETRDRRIFIDPGIALGFVRHGLPPHPFQVLMGAMIRAKMLAALKTATDVVMSHFHGDHVPLLEANPYQMRLDLAVDAMRRARIFCPGTTEVSGAMPRRRADLEQALGQSIADAGNKTDGDMTFSAPVPHGLAGGNQGSVMMTRIADQGTTVVHASDIQLLDSATVDALLDWRPDMVLVSGPPLYLKRLAPALLRQARDNAVRLARRTPVLILDHHLLRCPEGLNWLRSLQKMTEHRVLCAAEFMGRAPCLLEAWRAELYRELPVPTGWHEAYARGVADTSRFRHWREWSV